MADNLKHIILEEIFLDDDINFNIVLEGVNQLVQQFNIIPLERIQPVRNKNYYEVVIPSYNLDDFKFHFRMSKGTFEVLMNEVMALRNSDFDNQETIPFEKKLLLTIWVLSKQESFNSIGDRFDLAPSTAHNIFFEIISIIANLRHTKIMWPNLNERQRISRVLQNRSGIPGIVGLIDSCHIPIKAPPHNAVDFYNQNNYHSVILQGVCNDRREFIDVYVGIPGSVHDACVFKMSPLYNLLRNELEPPLLGNEHLLGDSDHPLLPFLLNPYSDNGNLTNAQVRFNTVMSFVRARIEQCFRILKGKFQRLKYLDMSVVDMIPTVITAACVLHNITRRDALNDDEDWDIDNHNQDQNEFFNMFVDTKLEEQAERNNVAERKRDYIASLL